MILIVKKELTQPGTPLNLIDQKLRNHTVDTKQCETTQEVLNKPLSFFQVIEQLQQNKQSEDKSQNVYDPDCIPPNFEIATQHHKALAVGRGVFGPIETTTYCECCARRVETPYIPLNCDLIELSFLGSGYPLYFTFIKFITLMLTIMYLSSGMFNTIGGYMSGLNFLTIVCIILLLHYFRYLQRKKDQDCDDADISANDYTIMISNIPVEYDALNDDYDDDLKDFLEKYALPDHKLNIVKVNLCYNIDNLLQLKEEKQKLIQKKQLFLKDAYIRNNCQDKLTEEDNSKINEFNKLIVEIKSKIYCLEYRFEDGKGKEFMKKYFSGYAFVSVETEKEKEDVIKRYKKGSSLCFLKKEGHTLKYHGNILEIKQAPYPTDIFWENLKLTVKEKRKRNVIGLIITVIILSVCFVAIFGLQMLQRSLITQYKSQSTNTPQSTTSTTTTTSTSSSTSTTNVNSTQISDYEKFISQLISIFISVVITFINQILRNVLNKISKLEGHPTITEYNISSAQKIAFVLFFNSSLIIFIIQIYISFDSRTPFEKIYGVGNEWITLITNIEHVFCRVVIFNLFIIGGLIQNQNYVFIINMVLPSLIEYLDIQGKLKEYQRKKERAKGDKCILTQHELNKKIFKFLLTQSLYEDPIFNIPLRYSSLLNTMFMTSFYSPILPLSILYSIGSLILAYWIDKYNVLYRRTIKNSLGSDLSIEMTEMIEYVLPIFSSSNLLFFLFITSYSQTAPKIAIAGICLGILNAFLPMQYINEKLFYVKAAEPNIQTYKEVEKTFKANYQNENPATANYGKKDFLQKFQQRRFCLPQIKNNLRVQQQSNANILQKELLTSLDSSPTSCMDSQFLQQIIQAQGNNQNQSTLTEKEKQQIPQKRSIFESLYKENGRQDSNVSPQLQGVLFQEYLKNQQQSIEDDFNLNNDEILQERDLENPNDQLGQSPFID